MNVVAELVSHPFVHRMGWTLVHLLWQAAGVGLLLAVVLRLLQRSAAAVRYGVACVALLLVVVLPIVTLMLIAAPPSPSISLPEPVVWEPPDEPLPASAVETRRVVILDSVNFPGPAGGLGWRQRVVTALEPALPVIVAGWFLGVLALSVWHIGGWVHVQRLKRRLVQPVQPSLAASLRSLSQKLGVTRSVRLCESALVQIPIVVGWLRPVILMPVAAVGGLSVQYLETLLAHELAHIRRGDYLVNLLQTVVEILGFYHPAIWWISGQIRVERENCCDDLAVSVCPDKVRYARALAEMERIRCRQGEPALAANGGRLLARVGRLIGKTPVSRHGMSWAAVLITVGLIAALAVPTGLALSRSADEARGADAAESATGIEPPAGPAEVIVRSGQGEDSSTTPLVTVRCENTDLRDLLAQISKAAGVRIITDPTVKPTPVTCSLRDLPLDLALRIVLAGTGYVVKQEDTSTYSVYRPIGRPLPSPIGESRAQIEFDFVVYEIPTDSELLKQGTDGGLVVRSDPVRVEQLKAMSETSDQVKVLSSPRVWTNEGQEAHMFVGNETPFIVGYEKQPSGESTPRVAYVEEGMSLKVVPHLVGGARVRADLVFKLTDITSVTNTVTEQGETQIPVLATAESTATVEIADGETVLVGGMRNPSKSNRAVVLQASARIRVAEDTAPPQGPPISEMPPLWRQAYRERHFVGPIAPGLNIPEKGDTSSKPVVREFRTQHRDAAEIGEALKRLFGLGAESFSIVAADSGANRLTVRTDEARALIEALIHALDAPLPDDTERAAPGWFAHSFVLQHGDVTQIADALKRLFGSDPAVLHIDAHAPSNTLVVAGKAPELVQVKGTIGVLEAARWGEGEGASWQAGVHTFDLEHTYVADVVDGLRRLSGPGVQRVPIVAADSGANRLTVQAEGRELERTRSLIEALDTVWGQGSAERSELRFMPKYGNPEDIANALRRFFGSEPGPAPIVGVDPRSKNIIIRANKSDAERILKLVVALAPPPSEEVEGTSSRRAYTFVLEHAHVADVADVLKRSTGPDGKGVRIVAVRAATNSLTVQVADLELDRVQSLIEALDAVWAQGDLLSIVKTSVQVFALRHVNAADTADALKRLFGPDSDNAPVVAVDATSNRLVVRSTVSEAWRMKGLIEALDTVWEQGSIEQFVLYVPPGHGNAEDIADAVKRLFGPESGTAPIVEVDPRSRNLIVLANKSDVPRMNKLTLALARPPSEKAEDASLQAGESAPAVLGGMGGMPTSYIAPSEGPEAGSRRPRQIEFEFVICEMPADSEWLKQGTGGELVVRSDPVYVEQLKAMSETSDQVKVLSSPKVLTHEGQEARVFVGTALRFTVGYEKQPSGASTPIVQTAEEGVSLTVVPHVVGGATVRADLVFRLTDITSVTNTVTEQGETQIPVLATAESTATVEIADGGTVLVGGMRNPSKSNRAVVLQASARIRVAEDTASPEGPPIPDILTVAPAGDGSSGPVRPVLRAFLIQHRDVMEIAETLKRLFGPDAKDSPIAGVDVRGSRLLVLTDEARAVLTEALISALDTPLPDEAGRAVPESSVQSYVLQTAGVTQIAEALKRLFGSDPNVLRIEVDAPSNTLLIAGKSPELARIRGVIGVLQAAQWKESEDASSDQGRPVFHVQYGDAVQIARALKRLFGPSAKDVPTVEADAESNRLIVEADESKLSLIEGLINALDAPPPAAGEGASSKRAGHVLPVEHGDATEIGKALARLLGSGPNAPIVTADGSSNRLVVEADELQLHLMKRLIAVLDVFVFTPENVQAGDLAEKLRVALGLKADDTRIVDVDTGSNRLMIRAQGPELERIKELIKALDTESIDGFDSPSRR